MSNGNDRRIIMAEEQSFLGTGWGFPPTFLKHNKSVKTISGIRDINSSLHVLLSTRLGERVMQPEYGCNLDIMLFENMNAGMKTYVKNLVENAILDYEPRINVEKVNVDTSRENEGILLIEIDYRVRNTNTRHNYVYPFYKNEGTDI
jgi:hypothetical protein